MTLQYYNEDLTKRADPTRFADLDLKGISLHEVKLQFGCQADATVIYHNIRIVGRIVGMVVHLDCYDSNNDLFATHMTNISKYRRKSLMQVTKVIYTVRRTFDGEGTDL